MINKIKYILISIAAAGFVSGCTEQTITSPYDDTEDICSDNDDCAKGQICSKGKCVKEKKPAVACSKDTPCKEGKCIDGLCVIEDLNTACSQDSDCKEGLTCHRGTCSKKVHIGGDCSEEYSYCAVGKCIKGICKEVTEEDLIDTDGDTIPDTFDRCDEDTDGDTIPNCKDEDSDGDTIPDSVEAGTDGDPTAEPRDSDFDDIPDFKSLDSDGNGIPDSVEAGSDPNHPVDTDGDTIPDYISEDNDGDHSYDIEEIKGMTLLINGQQVPGRLCGGAPCPPGTSENPWDSDGDTIPDYMDTDSDNDTIPDSVEGKTDSNRDGQMDRYSEDSDGDTIPDNSERDANGDLLSYTDANGSRTWCFQSNDCDKDSIPDNEEISCSGKTGIATTDIDGDGFSDASELAAGEYAMINGTLTGVEVTDPKSFVCDPSLGVKDVFNFYFELPYQGDQKDDLLEFIPKVSKLDLVFNVDTTASMQIAINSVKQNIGSIIQKVQAMVKDSGFALTNFDDYPAGVTWAGKSSRNNDLFVPFGVQNNLANDLPFRLLGTISTDPAVVTSYTQNPIFTTQHGEDGAESGTESLYQIATGAGTKWKAGSYHGDIKINGEEKLNYTLSWNGGSTPPQSNAPNTWGGVDFRRSSLPIVIHTTDALSHDSINSYLPVNFSNIAYNQYVDAVVNPHYTPELIPVLKQTGIRVITLGVPNQQNIIGADEAGQMTVWAKESNAVVPACAFENKCGPNKCCLGTTAADPVSIDGKDNQCILYYTSQQSDISTYMTQGVEALIKYGTYEVAARIIGDPIPGSDKTTGCFIKQVKATAYIAPPQEPEKSCNPTALPSEIGNAGYNNGFKDFAPGTSSNDRDGARLHFTVVAQNDDCVASPEKTQIYKAYIEVYNPTTGLVFDRQQVSIMVPPDLSEQIN